MQPSATEYGDSPGASSGNARVRISTMGRCYSIVGSTTITITPRARLRYRKPKNGKRKHRYETLSYPDKDRNGRWVQISRIFDRENDEYIERVVDEKTSQVIRETREPLSQHLGHGSDRKNR